MRSKDVQLLSLPPGCMSRSSESEEDEAFKGMDKEYRSLKAKWTEDKQSARLAVSTLQQQVADRDRVIEQQRTMMTNLQSVVSTKNRIIEEQGIRLKEIEARVLDGQRQKMEEQQSRLQELEACLAEEKRAREELAARNAQLMTITSAIHGAFASHRDVVQLLLGSPGGVGSPVNAPQDLKVGVEAVVDVPKVDGESPTVVPIPVVAAEQIQAAVVDGASESLAEKTPVAAVDGPSESASAPRDPTPPPSAPEPPIEPVAEHVEVDTEPVVVPPPLPVADDTPPTGSESVGADVDMPPALSVNEQSKEPAAAHKPIIVVLPIKPALRSRPPIDSENPASPEITDRPKKTVSFSPLLDQVGVVPGKRKRAESLVTSYTCRVCLVDFVDEAALRGHVCPLQRIYQCGTDGCQKTFGSASSKRRHENAAHVDKPKLRAAKSGPINNSSSPGS
ncbi:tropomyosin-1, isoforms 33/34-like isoform X2 [Paramacrobiotus metropolitanus]|uniref:tropomyosin-1, isoforms 33/34-like isoform X2 n=1 Tax=Paramacrobiotus metropolitanus TaxID=2943436 RepID=UPI002446302D|nr:tropomyosin-1, isoforms 33/34-like isoform X2 [Paramacrobiotus metropolitanus]